MNIAGVGSSSILTKNSNKDYNEGDLRAALTCSTYPPTASGVILELDGGIYTSPLNLSTYPMDTVFFFYDGTPPIEIYDWYIYKIS